MNKQEIIELSKEGEKQFDGREEELAVTPPSGRDNPQFSFKDIDDKFKSFIIRDPLILLVGSNATQGKGADIDIVPKDQDLPDILKEAIRFRLFRQLEGEFSIDYDETPKYLHFHDEPFGSYTDYYPLYCLKVERIPNEYIHRMSLDNDKNITENFEILEKDKEFVIGGIVSTTAVDLENERISSEALRGIWNSIKKTPDEFRGLYKSHTSIQIGKLLMEYKNRKSALVNDKLYLIFKLRDDISIAKDIIKKIKSGELNNFSIKFGVKNPDKNIREVCNREVCISEILGGTYFLEVSTTDSPSNKEAGPIEILSKKEANNIE